MPAPIVCPHCREELDIPTEYHGRSVRCASCQNVFMAVASNADTPVVHRTRNRPDEGDENSPRFPEERRPWPDDRDPRPGRLPKHDNGIEDRPARRSNVGVVGLLLLTALTIGGCCGGMNVLLATQVNPAFSPYSSVEGRFKVEFPGESPTNGPTTNPADPTIEGVEASSRRDYGQELYRVKSYNLKADWRKLSAEEALEKVAVAELESLTSMPDQRKVLRYDTTKHQGYEARDVIAGDGNGLTGRDTMLRCILAGQRVYVVVYQAQKVQPEYWWVRKYFLSLEITEPTAKKENEPKKERKED